METFWEGVSKTVKEKTGLDFDKYKESVESQKDVIIDFLTFTCYPDVECEEIVDIKRKILLLYTKEISSSVSKIEIYEHDLNATVVSGIFELMQNVVMSELTEDITDKKMCYARTLQFTYFLKHMLHDILIELYCQRINLYKRHLRDFKRNGVRINNEKFDDVVKPLYKNARNEYKKCKHKYVSYFSKDDNIIRYQDVEEDIGFEKVVKELERLVSLYEENYPNIIDNGYNMSAKYRIFDAFINIATIIIIISSVIKFL